MASNDDLEDLEEDQDAIKLDELGPMILNTDGTISRISNWHSFTASEKSNAIRLITKRNKARKEQLIANPPPKPTEPEEAEPRGRRALPCSLPSADSDP